MDSSSQASIASTAGDDAALAHTPGWRLVDVLLIAIASAVIIVLGIVGLSAFKSDMLLVTLSAAALEAVALIGSVYILGLRRRKFGWEAVGLRTPSAGWVFAAVAAGGVCLIMTGVITLLVQTLLGQKLQNPQLPFLAPGGFTWIGAIGMFLLAGLVVPFAEELFFRGVLYAWLRGRWGVWVGVVGSALIFGAVHGDVSIAAGIAFMGLIQAFVYERSRSLWTVVLIHAINNGVKVALLYLLLAMGVRLTGA